MIAELVDHYRNIILEDKHQKGDYPFIGRLYNDNGYDEVLAAISEVGYKLDTGFIDNPLSNRWNNQRTNQRHNQSTSPHITNSQTTE